MPQRYDDGGFTGANMDRPALTRLLAAVEAEELDCVVVYKVDRLSRSLLDLTRILNLFEKHNVIFVTATQQFNTSTSLGRLTLLRDAEVDLMQLACGGLNCADVGLTSQLL